MVRAGTYWPKTDAIYACALAKQKKRPLSRADQLRFYYLFLFTLTRAFKVK